MIQDIDNINVSIQDDNNVNVTVENDSINISEGTPTDIAEIMHNEEIRQENEAQRIANEEQRIANEEDREEYIADLKQKVEDGDFDGFSPTAYVTKSDDTATITITDKNGTTTASISDGTDGIDGTDGEDGFSPVVTMEKQGKVTTLTITDATGTHTTEIKDGNDGSGTGDMLKATYDTNDNGVVDNAEKVNNHTVETDVPANAVFTDTTYTAGAGIDITNNVISNTGALKQEQLTEYINSQHPFILDNYEPGIYFFKPSAMDNAGSNWWFQATSTSTLHTPMTMHCNLAGNYISVYKKFSDANIGDIVASVKVGLWAQYNGGAYWSDYWKDTPTQILIKSSSTEVDIDYSVSRIDYIPTVSNGKTNEFMFPQKYNNNVAYEEWSDYGLIYKKYVDDLGNTKQNVIDSSHMLDADLVDDTNASNKFLTTSAQNIWGKKTFQSLPEYAYTTNPVLDTQFVHKKYVDSKFMYQRDTMPTAGEDYYNKIFQYIGTTNANYTNGYFYKCERSGTSPNYTYNWVRTDVQPSFSGDYNDLSNKPTIPDELADLSDDSTHRVVTDTEKTTWSGKQDALVSGTNIKTINNTSLLGSGDIEVGADIPQQDTAPSNPEEDDLWIDTDEPGATIAIDSAVSTTSTNPIENQAITNYVNKLSSYSSTETIIGTFLGKPLYRKVLYFPNSTSVVNAGQFNCNVSNGERMWIETAWYEITGSNATIPFGWNLGGTNWLRMSVQNYTTGLCQVNASSNFTSSTQRDVYIILNYTKSTD